MKEIVIASGVRTPVGTFGGAFKDVSAVELGKIVVEEAIKRANIKPDMIDEVIFGNVLQAGLGQNVARQVAIHAGIPVEVPSYTVNKVCGSGLKTVALAAQAILAGDADIIVTGVQTCALPILIVAGGTENMSQAPYLLKKARWGMRMGNGVIEDYMIHDGLWDIFGDTHMGITAENVAEKWGITREEQDQFSLRSQQRSEAAIKSGRFKDEIIPVAVPQRKGDPKIVDTDEHPRFGSTIEGMRKLKPAFKKDGTVTAGNASGINDGAAALVIMSKEKADELGIKPIATILSYASAGVEPSIMGTGPIPATRKALKKINMKVEDMDLVEANEAFAAQSLAVVKELGLDPAKTNVNGGAIALGHPIGASGARILVTLLYEMMKRDSKLGLATLCIGGGQGIAMVVKR
mgnify:CR=1 FL=1